MPQLPCLWEGARETIHRKKKKKKKKKNRANLRTEFYYFRRKKEQKNPKQLFLIDFSVYKNEENHRLETKGTEKAKK